MPNNSESSQSRYSYRPRNQSMVEGNPFSGYNTETQRNINAWFMNYFYGRPYPRPQPEAAPPSNPLRVPGSASLFGVQPSANNPARPTQPYYNPRNPLGVAGGGGAYTPLWQGLPGWQPNWLGGGFSYSDPMYNQTVTLNPDGTINMGGAGGGGWDYGVYTPGSGSSRGTRGWGLVPGRQNYGEEGKEYTNSWAVAHGLAAPSWRGGGQVEHGISAYIPGVSPEPGTMGDRPPIGEPRRRVAADLNPNPWKVYAANRKRRFQDKYGVKPGQGSGVTSMGVGGMASWNP